MANLFWKKNGKTKSLLSTPFKTEEDFEKEIFNTQEILEDIFLIKRQIRGGKNKGIPDIVGIDNDGNICIIEIKNFSVDVSFIPQVLKYAYWAENNPDSIKSLWLECDNKPDDIAISWDSFQVRIIVIAPSILRSTLDIVDKIEYPVDLIEVKRWVEEKNSLYLVNKLGAGKTSRTKPTSGMQIYDEEFYKKEYNKKSAIAFIKYAKEVESFVAQRDWSLELKFNKRYCGFKAGFYNAFGINWVGSKTFAFFFKITEDVAKSINIKMTRYESQWKQAIYYIEPGKTEIKEYEPLFELAYKRLTGN